MDSSSGQKNIQVFRRVTKPMDLCFRMESMAIRPKNTDTFEQHPSKFRTSQTRKMKFLFRNQASLHEKPPYSYATLIGSAIISSKEYRLTLREIYESISKKYPFYKLGEKGWQNSVCHNLALNKKYFKKLESRSTPSGPCYWTVNPGFAKIIVENHGFKTKL